MALTRVEAAALALSAVVAVAMPLALFRPGEVAPAVSRPRAAHPLAVPTPPPLSVAFARPVFATDMAGDGDAAPADVPRLVGIAGRIGTDAVALVRDAAGDGRTLEVGAAVDGWTLESLAIDAAYFTRGTRRARVPLPAG